MIIVDSDLLDTQRRALAKIVVDNQLPTSTERDDLEGLLELLHAIEDDRLSSLGDTMTIEWQTL